MSVYIDGPLSEAYVQDFGRGSKFAGGAHLVADTLDELHTFAGRLGLRRVWFQDGDRFPHYDLTASRRDAAVAKGAQHVEKRSVVEIAKRCLAVGR